MRRPARVLPGSRVNSLSARALATQGQAPVSDGNASCYCRVPIQFRPSRLMTGGVGLAESEGGFKWLEEFH